MSFKCSMIIRLVERNISFFFLSDLCYLKIFIWLCFSLSSDIFMPKREGRSVNRNHTYYFIGPNFFWPYFFQKKVDTEEFRLKLSVNYDQSDSYILKQFLLCWMVIMCSFILYFGDFICGRKIRRVGESETNIFSTSPPPLLLEPNRLLESRE